MNQIPETGFLKLAQIIGNPKATPPAPAIIPVSKATWHAGVKTGRYPAPVHIGGGRGAFYRVEDSCLSWPSYGACVELTGRHIGTATIFS